MAVAVKGVKVEVSRELGRPLRKDAPENLGQSTWGALEDAIRAGNQAEAIRILEYLHEGEVAPAHYSSTDWLYGNQTYLVENWGQEAYEEMLRSEESWALSSNMLGGFQVELLEDIEALVKRQAEIMRAHEPPRGAIIIVEEPDRYVMNFFPCYSGGRQLQSGMTEGKWSLAVNNKPTGAFWSRTGKPIYCGHCALGRGIMISQVRGFPVRVADDPGSGFNPDREHPFDPCRMVFYKRPEDIPEKYFKALGLKKDPSKFQVVPTHMKAQKK